MEKRFGYTVRRHGEFVDYFEGDSFNDSDVLRYIDGPNATILKCVGDVWTVRMGEKTYTIEKEGL